MRIYTQPCRIPTELTVRAEWISEGTHVMIAGVPSLDAHSIAAALAPRGHLFVERRSDGPARNAVGLIDVADKRADGRRSARDITIFEAAPMTNAQVVAADSAFRNSMNADTGRDLDL